MIARLGVRVAAVVGVGVGGLLLRDMVRADLSPGEWAFSIIIALAWIMPAVGVLFLRPWARQSALILAIVGVTGQLIVSGMGLFATYAFDLPTHLGGLPTGLTTMSTGTLVRVALAWNLGWIVLLTRRSVKAQFDQKTRT
jgi:hypothetical protein